MVALRRHKRLGALLVLIGIAAGIALATARPAVYTAETRLAVAGGNLTAEAVPGFALASQQMASNYARYVDNAEAQGALEAKLGVRAGTVSGVAASPIPESNVLRIEVTAKDAGAATRAAATVAKSLIQKVADSAGASDAMAAATLRQYTDMTTKVSDQQLVADAATAAVRNPAAHPGAALPDLQKAAADASTQLAILKVQQDALAQKYRNELSAGTGDAVRLTVVEDAVVTGNDRLARVQQFGLAGAVLGALAALLLAVVREGGGPGRGNNRRAAVPAATVREDAPTEPAMARAQGATVTTAAGQRAG
jgi:uncharacterized protein involved in exopolysaccharide biosynthesis